MDITAARGRGILGRYAKSIRNRDRTYAFVLKYPFGFVFSIDGVLGTGIQLYFPRRPTSTTTIVEPALVYILRIIGEGYKVSI